jgi:NAD(P)-dependent dehydrogenase (short-subunit alcohol dehydrogenase family)
MGEFDGKVVLISGTGGRQGRVAAMMFANAGARVLGGDIAVERSMQTTELVRRAGGEMVSPEPLTWPIRSTRSAGLRKRSRDGATFATTMPPA